MPFEFEKLALNGLILVKPKKILDGRGFFQESYKKSEFAAAGIAEEFVQDNQARSVKGVLRGLHYQRAPRAQGKLVRCTAGAILDVGVDLRRGSGTFGKWVAAELTAENGFMLYVPAGFAHGYLVLSDTADIIYKCTAEYSPADEGGLRWNDPDLGVAWGVTAPTLSGRDAALPAFKGFEGL
jgi:dTDP-4-dehydrorhamnose 3,5-epimerase